MPRVVPSLGPLRSECFVKFCASNSSFIFWSLSLEVFLIDRDNYVEYPIKIPNFTFV